MAPHRCHPKGKNKNHATEPQISNPIENPALVVQQNDVQDASERLEGLQEEQLALEKELQKKSQIFELNKQRIKDAQSIVSLNKARVEASKLPAPTTYQPQLVGPFPLPCMSS